MIERYVFPVSVVLKSPFIFADVDASGIGIDTPALRNSNDCPVLPADHFKGLLRQAFAALATKVSQAFSIDGLFGPPKDQMQAYQPVRGSLHFQDLVCDEVNTALDITRIRIDDKTGTVEDGMLQVVELAVPLGKPATFSGVVIWHGTKAGAMDLQQALQKALRIIPYFGGLRSAGFGRHLRDKSMVEAPTAEPLDKSITIANGKRYKVTARFDRPVAVNVAQLAANIFEGSAVVPGSAIKGALAEMLKAGGVAPTAADMAALSSLRVSHAFAVGDHGKPLDRALPLSYCRFDKGIHANEFRNELGRAASNQGHCNGVCGDFLPDMKGERISALAKKLDRKNSDFDAWSLGHTEISDATGTATEGQLFVVIALDTKRRDYSFTIDVPNDGNDYSKILSRLNGGLDRIGKTEARLQIMKIEVIDLSSDDITQTFNFILETPALFMIPKEGDDAMPADQRLKQYFNHYGLTLEDHFCQRALVGGFPVLRDRSLNSYRPFALFAAGSCFRISGPAGNIKTFCDTARLGLPVLREDANGKLAEESDWEKCLYLPQNGYGEITINPDFLEMKP